MRTSRKNEWPNEGLPIYQVNGDRRDVPDSCFAGVGAFAVEVRGYAMQPYFLDGDVGIFAPEAKVEGDDVCCVALDDERFVIARVTWCADGTFRLFPGNMRFTSTGACWTHEADRDEALVRVVAMVKCIGVYRAYPWTKAIAGADRIAIA
jgi:hypothetical protein